MWIVEQIRYRPTDQPTNGHSQLKRCVGTPKKETIFSELTAFKLWICCCRNLFLCDPTEAFLLNAKWPEDAVIPTEDADNPMEVADKPPEVPATTPLDAKFGLKLFERRKFLSRRPLLSLVG